MAIVSSASELPVDRPLNMQKRTSVFETHSKGEMADGWVVSSSTNDSADTEPGPFQKLTPCTSSLRVVLSIDSESASRSWFLNSMKAQHGPEDSIWSDRVKLLSPDNTIADQLSKL
eukprot:2269892-Amphidinium_carterae.1